MNRHLAHHFLLGILDRKNIFEDLLVGCEAHYRVIRVQLMRFQPLQVLVREQLCHIRRGGTGSDSRTERRSGSRVEVEIGVESKTRAVVVVVAVTVVRGVVVIMAVAVVARGNSDRRTAVRTISSLWTMEWFERAAGGD
jgi:hypothetical protein